MSKTIKELADSLGVSKTAIRKYMDEDFRAAHTVTNRNGVITIDSAGCLLIAETMGKQWEESASTENKIPETPESTENPLYAILREQLATLNKQLDEKDSQIKQLQKDLETERQHSREQSDKFADKLAELAKGAQQLHAGSIKQQLGAGEPAHGEEVAIDAEPVDSPAAPEPGMLRKILMVITGKL